LEEILFTFRKVSEEEMRIADELKNVLKKTRESLAANLDKKDAEYITLYEELRRLFADRNLDEVTQEEMTANIASLQQIYDKVTELNRKNNLLLDKYNDAQAVRFTPAGVVVASADARPDGAAARPDGAAPRSLPLADDAAGPYLAARAALGRYFGPDAGFGEIAGIDYTDGVRVSFGGGDVAHLRRVSRRAAPSHGTRAERRRPGMIRRRSVRAGDGLRCLASAGHVARSAMHASRVGSRARPQLERELQGCESPWLDYAINYPPGSIGYNERGVVEAASCGAIPIASTSRCATSSAARQSSSLPLSSRRWPACAASIGCASTHILRTRSWRIRAMWPQSATRSRMLSSTP
jgi:hypothetical protein